MRYVQADHGDVGTGMEHAICGFRILNDVRFRGQIPTVAFLRQRAAHHHQFEFAGNIRCGRDRSINIGQRTGRNHSDVETISANLINNELHAFGNRVGGRIINMNKRSRIRSKRQFKRINRRIRMNIIQRISANGNQTTIITRKNSIRTGIIRKNI